MADRIPQRFAFVVSNCTDPSRIEEFDRWYSDFHIPEMLKMEGFVRGTRYRLATAPAAGQAQTLVLYELDVTHGYRAINSNMRRDMASMREGQSRQYLDILDGVASGFFEQVSEQPVWPAFGAPGAADATPPGGLFLELTRCTDYAQAEDLDRWYADVHIPQMLHVPGIRRATRYQWPKPLGGQTAFMQLYESALDDPETLASDATRLPVRDRAEGPPALAVLQPVVHGLYALASDCVRLA